MALRPLLVALFLGGYRTSHALNNNFDLGCDDEYTAWLQKRAAATKINATTHILESSWRSRLTRSHLHYIYDNAERWWPQQSNTPKVNPWAPPPISTDERDWMEGGELLLFSFAITAVFVRVMNFCLEGTAESSKSRLASRAIQKATPLSMSAICVYAISRIPGAEGWFSVSTAITSIVAVFELNTVERMLMKTVMRMAGTFMGTFLALLILFTIASAAQWPSVCLIILVVFTLQSTLAQLYKDTAYTFRCSNLTFGIIFFGYIGTGWSAVENRIVSVNLGIITATLMEYVCPAILHTGEQSALSNDMILSNATRILDLIFATIDFTFVNAELNAHDSPSDKVSTLWCEDRIFHQSQSLPGSSLVDPGLISRCAGTTVAEALAFLKVSDHGELAEEELSSLMARSRTYMEDIKTAAFLTYREPPNNLYELCKDLHPVHVQASAMALSFRSLSKAGKQFFKEHEELFDNLRLKLGTLSSPFTQLVQLCGQVTRHKGDLAQPHKDAVDHVVKELLDALRDVDDACMELISTWSEYQEEHSIPWRFATFIQFNSVVVAELGNFALECARNYGSDITEECADPASMKKKSAIARVREQLEGLQDPEGLGRSLRFVTEFATEGVASECMTSFRSTSSRPTCRVLKTQSVFRPSTTNETDCTEKGTPRARSCSPSPTSRPVASLPGNAKPPSSSSSVRSARFLIP